MLIAITGATGFLGRPLAARLEAAGHTVVPVPRHYGLVPEADAVVHLAGESIAGLWTARKRAAILESRVEGTRRLVDRLRRWRRPPEVLVCASGAGYYGHRPGEVLTEESAAGTGFRAEVCRAWEAEALAAGELGVRTVLLRFGSILHPSGGFLGRLLPFARRGLCFVIGRGSDRLSWIGLEDALRMIEFALQDGAVRGPVNATAPEAATQEEFARAVAAALRRRVVGRLPRTVLRLALGEFSSALLDSQDVRPRRALAAGFRFEQRQLRLAELS